MCNVYIYKVYICKYIMPINSVDDFTILQYCKRTTFDQKGQKLI